MGYRRWPAQTVVLPSPHDENCTMADCTNAAIRNIFLLKKCEYKPDNKKAYGSHLVDNSWGKTYKGWPTSIELHMGYKRDELRMQMIDRGNRAITGATRISTRSPTRDRHGSLLPPSGLSTRRTGKIFATA